MGRPDIGGSTPPYAVIAADLMSAIGRGDYTPGNRLPTIKELAVKYDVSPGTIQSALGVLRDRGVVTTRHGTGTFVRPDLDVAQLGTMRGAPEGDLSAVLELLRDIQARLIDIDGRLP